MPHHQASDVCGSNLISPKMSSAMNLYQHDERSYYNKWKTPCFVPTSMMPPFIYSDPVNGSPKSPMEDWKSYFQHLALLRNGMSGMFSSPYIHPQQMLSARYCGPLVHENARYNHDSGYVHVDHMTVTSLFCLMNTLPQWYGTNDSMMHETTAIGPCGPTTRHSRQRVEECANSPGLGKFGRSRKLRPKIERTLWIGNLPQQTSLMQIVQHVCQRTKGLASLFFMGRSKCAFANFKSEALCLAAQQKIHKSRFQSVRLVSRLRKGSAEQNTDTLSSHNPTSQDGESSSSDTKPAKKADSSSARTCTEPTVGDGLFSAKRSGDRFFIMKSFGVEDLEQSVKTGLWATQPHNEEALNHAFQSSDNVYLIFSANKSGGYFGYARMTSEVNADPAAVVDLAPKAMAEGFLNHPPTLATRSDEFVPEGRISIDVTRGTLLWEAERDGFESDSGSDDESLSTINPEETHAHPFCGKQFRIEWLCTDLLPFTHTRSLRNPWNLNREIKVARDGTELEPSVGRRLLNLFSQKDDVDSI